MDNNYKNYFQQTISRYNSQQFVQFLKPEQIQRAAKERLFREMVRGQIDYGKYGQYFLDPKFLENLIIAADNELKNNNVCSLALSYYDCSFPGNQDVIYNKSRFVNLCIIYNNILQRLMTVKATGNVGVMTDIPYVLSSYRNVI
jgi:hypothetical protein